MGQVSLKCMSSKRSTPNGEKNRVPKALPRVRKEQIKQRKIVGSKMEKKKQEKLGILD